ncbi:MAG: UbiX family flavin prenyltransferase [Thermoplasmata archaeon]|nr:UbiX family flavin prenyltransferase [Thermoplasmata archaeon]
MRIVIGITGASGVDYAVTLLKNLKEEKLLIISEHGKRLIEIESDITRKEIESLAEVIYDDNDLEASISSGGSDFDAMVIVPCSMSTLSKIACGIADTLITRTASVSLKEGRRLVIVPRETPLSRIHIDNMSRLAGAGATVLPAMPAFYTRPKQVQDMVDFVVGKIIESLGLEHELYKKWE